VSFRLAAGVACAIALWICASPAAAAAPTPILMPSPTTPLTARPPVGERKAALPQRLPLGRVAARTRVVAELDRRGAPIAVTAVQRLTIRGVGDYFFTIPAPVRDVLPGPGTQSEPGLRPGLVLWQGFSGGNRVLSARLLLESARVAQSLPIRVRLSRTGSFVTIELTNATGVRVSSFTAVAGPGEARRYLAALARFAAGGPAPHPYVNATNVRVVERTIVAPLRVTGALVFPAGRRVRVDVVLGAGRRNVRVATASRGLPKLELIVTPILFGRETPARPTFGDVMERALRLARSRQYDTFLVNPDATGTTQTTYVFRTTASRAAVASPAPRRDPSFPFGTLAIALGLGVLLVAAVVAWAHA
jgi:hypothetical protein